MIYTFDKVKDFMQMVDLQVNRAVITVLAANNSYTHVWELYFFDDILRGFKQKPMSSEKALWFGEGTTLEQIKIYNEMLALRIERLKYKLPPKSIQI